MYVKRRERGAGSGEGRNMCEMDRGKIERERARASGEPVHSIVYISHSERPPFMMG